MRRSDHAHAPVRERRVGSQPRMRDQRGPDSENTTMSVESDRNNFPAWGKPGNGPVQLTDFAKTKSFAEISLSEAPEEAAPL